MYRTALSIFTAVLASAQNPAWKVEIDNPLVQAARCTVAPRSTAPPAGISQGLLVFLTDFSVRITGDGGQKELEGKPGEFLWYSSGQIGIENLSGEQLEVLWAAPKLRPEPGGASYVPRPDENRPNLKFENDLIRVRRFWTRGSRRVLAENRLPGMTVFFDPAHIRFTYADGRVEELRLNAKQIRFSAGGSFTVENLGDDHEVMWIDLKTSKQARE
jgi:hypothetical protein